MSVYRGGAKAPGTFSETREKSGLGLGDREGMQRQGCPLTIHPHPRVKSEEACGRVSKPDRAFSGSPRPSLGTVLITIITSGTDFDL